MRMIVCVYCDTCELNQITLFDKFCQDGMIVWAVLGLHVVNYSVLIHFLLIIH